jgi:hypothetical protein
MGDNGDARLIVYICEHWYLLFRGQGSWRNLGFFFPVKGLLGWSDTFFLYEIFFAPLRLLGCDPFLALQITLILLSAVGFVSFVLLVRSAFGAPHLIALVGGILFTFSNTLWLHVNSPQLLGVYFVPLILLIGLSAWRAVPDHPRRSIALAAIAGMALALLFYTTYYVAWFSLLASGVIVAVSVVAGRRALISQAWAALRWRGRPVAAGLIGFGVGIIPFALTYLPVLRQFGGLHYGQALAYAPSWRGVADVGPGNLFWTGLVDRLASARAFRPYEVTFGQTPVLLGLTVVGAAIAARRLRKGTAALPAVARTSAVLALTALVLIVLPVRIRHQSLWVVVWHIPGATAIRAIDRLQVITGLTVCLALVAAATELSYELVGAQATHLDFRRRSGFVRTAGVALLLIAVAEQFNTTDKSRIDRPAQLHLLRAVTRPPPGCRSFFVVDTGRGHQAGYDYQIDAMLISQEMSIPTLNGYTAHAPAGWRLNTPFRRSYLPNVEAWADKHGVLSGLCQLDLHTMRWVTDPALPGPQPPAGVRL